MQAAGIPRKFMSLNQNVTKEETTEPQPHWLRGLPSLT